MEDKPVVHRDVTRDDLKKLQEYFLKKIELLSSSVQEVLNNKEAMQESPPIRHSHSVEIDKLADALAKAQSTMTIAMKDSKTYNSVYATFPDLKKAADPSLNKNGLSVIQLYRDGSLVTNLIHSSGQWICSVVNIKEYMNPNTKLLRQQEFGSTRSYLKRYAYQDITGVIDEKEDDNNGYNK